MAEKTGATPFLRKGVDPETRIQDSKEELLCRDCEQQLNEWETKFATYLFHPYINGQKYTFEYDEWLQKFIITVAWRFLVADETDLASIEEPHRSRFQRKVTEWREILLENKSLDTDDSSFYICFLEAVDSGDAPDKTSWYLERSIDATAVLNGETHVYFKFPQMCFFACIEPSETDQIENGRIGTSGELDTVQNLRAEFGTFLMSRVEGVSQNELSASEQQKIADWAKENPDRVAESESFQTYLKERQRKREQHNLLDYLDEECPICGFEHEVIDTIPNVPLQDNHLTELRQSPKIHFVNGRGLEGEALQQAPPQSPVAVIVISIDESTRVATLYSEIGYVVEERIPHDEEMTGVSPEEVGQWAWENVNHHWDDALSP